ncbi:hypothetical protein RJ640_029096, partial [Escallonia rubra]
MERRSRLLYQMVVALIISNKMGMLLETFLVLKIQGFQCIASGSFNFKEKKEKPDSEAKWRNFTKGFEGNYFPSTL